MKKGMNRILLMGIFFSFPFFQSCAQQKNIIVKSEAKSSDVNRKDKNGLRQGYWFVADTTYTLSPHIIKYKSVFLDSLYPAHIRDSLMQLKSTEQSQSINNDTIISIYISEGNYSNNTKAGLWKYSAVGKPYRSEIRYTNDAVNSILIFDMPNHIYLKAIPDYGSETVIYEKFNEKNIVVEKGKFPLQFLHALTGRILW